MSKEKSLFLYKNYKEYLIWKLQSFSKRVGSRRRLAQAINCQATYITQVLNGQAHFTLEQAHSINDYLGHNESESHFFLLLVQLERSGTISLKNYFRNQILEINKNRELLATHLNKKNSLTIEQQTQYYSSWQYSAIHIALSLIEKPPLDQLSLRLGIPLERVNYIIQSLIEMGLIIMTEKGYQLSQNDTFIGQNSLHLARHHSSWRIQAINNIEKGKVQDLHYTAVYSLSRDDRERLKENIIALIQKNLKIVHSSPEESLFIFTADFFELI